MPIALRAAAMVAGILGGSGTHVVQIIIAIVVAAALIGYFLLRVGGRSGGGDVRAAAAAVRQHDRDIDRAHEGAVSDATVRLVRTWSGIGIGAQSEQWNIAMDGTVVGSIANKETVELAVAPGHHTLRLGSGRHRSTERSFDVAQDEVVGFSCNGPRFKGMLAGMKAAMPVREWHAGVRRHHLPRPGQSGTAHVTTPFVAMQWLMALSYPVSDRVLGSTHQTVPARPRLEA